VTKLDLISLVYRASYDIKLHKYLKCSTSRGCLWFTFFCDGNCFHL